MTSQADRARAFHALHVKGDPVILYNAWDAGSAKIIAEVGAKAIATGSYAVAAAQGYPDGEGLPLDLVIANLERIVETVDLPVTLDFEGCYAVNPDGVTENVSRAIVGGAIGINFEDQVVGGEGLHPIEVQVERIAAARNAAEAAGVDLFINARTDIFLKAPLDSHDAAMVDQALEREAAYRAAGASGFFAPLLADEALIGRLCDAAELPVNIMAFKLTPPAARLAELGVARISHGGGSYRAAMMALSDAAKEVYGTA
jgi:2-methylisocitrate lyase-like PEP mutase family enzyme